MLADFIATGVFGARRSGSIIANRDQTIIFPQRAGFSSKSPDLPLGAIAWPRPFDPSDFEPYAADFSNLLDGARIVDLRRVTVSASAALFGFQISSDSARRPIVSADGTTVQMWFLVDPDMQDDAAFSGQGVKVGVSMLIRTNGSPYQEYERTGVINLRQL